VVVEILRARLKKHEFKASQETVDERVSICKKCIACVDWKKHCSPCHAKVEKILPALTKPAKPDTRMEGKACLFARDDLSVAVRRTSPEELPGAPSECWRGVKGWT